MCAFVGNGSYMDYMARQHYGKIILPQTGMGNNTHMAALFYWKYFLYRITL